MGKLLLLLVVVAIALVAVRIWARKAAGSAERSAPPPPQDMVRCLHCGVHLPHGEAVANERGFFCCEAHGREPPAH